MSHRRKTKPFFVTAITAVVSILFSFLFACSANGKAVTTDVIKDTTTTPAHVKVTTYLALGDSYTIGQSVDSSERFPAQTAAILKRHGFVIPSIEYIATTGWKTVNLQWALEAQKTSNVYDVVTLLIGVNDQYLKRDTTDYRSHFTNLLQKAIGLAGNNTAHVFVLSIPDYGITPFGGNNQHISEQIDQFNVINKNVSLSYGVNYTDVTGISRYDAIDTTMLAFDEMHPSGKQYAQWAQALANKILRVFE